MKQITNDETWHLLLHFVICGFFMILGCFGTAIGAANSYGITVQSGDYIGSGIWFVVFLLGVFIIFRSYSEMIRK